MYTVNCWYYRGIAHEHFNHRNNITEYKPKNYRIKFVTIRWVLMFLKYSFKILQQKKNYILKVQCRNNTIILVSTIVFPHIQYTFYKYSNINYNII